ARLRDELQAVLGDGQMEPEHVGRLEYLDAVLKETQRLTPVIGMTGRLLRAPARINGWELPAGGGGGPSPGPVPPPPGPRPRPALWPEPARFRPERFLGMRPSPFHFFPFGGGVRRCLGAAFSTYEMKVVLSEVLRRAELRIADGYRLRAVQRAITSAPSAGMP